MRHGADPLLDRFYGVAWRAIPNLAIDLIVPPLAGLVGIFVAAKIFMLLDMVLLLTGPHAIHYALTKRFSIGPLAAALFLYNATDTYGNVNYEVGVGAALWAVAAWIAMRQSSAWLRGLVSAACVVGLFFCHLEAAAIYGLAIFSVEAPLVWARRTARRVVAIEATVLLLPFVLEAPLLHAGPHDSAALPMHWGGAAARVRGIREVFTSYYWQPDALVFVAVIAGLGWLAWRRILIVPPRVWVFALVGGGLFIVMPNEAMGAWGAAVRLPVGLLFVAIGLLRWEFVRERDRMAFLLGLLLILTVRAGEVELAYHRNTLVRHDIEDSLRLIAPGSRVLVAREGQPAVDAAIEYLTSLATIERSSLNSLNFSHPSQQVLVVRPPFRASTGGYDDDPVPVALLLAPPRQSPPNGFRFDPSGRIYWANWQRDYDYLYVLDPDSAANPAPNRLVPLYAGRRFELFRITPPSAP
jgi:hypothetical protein